MTRVGFCGLGVMGYPMAGHLASAGHSVSVYNRTSARADAWAAAYSGTALPTPRDVAANSDIVMLCIPEQHCQLRAMLRRIPTL